MSSTNELLLPQIIATKRLTLRPFRFSDVPDLFAYLQEPEMGQFLEGPSGSPTEDETASIVARHILVDRQQRSVWAIALSDVVIGGVSINLEKEHRIAEIGYSVKKALWGQGYASEAANAVVDTTFETYPNLQRIQANIHPQNEGSIRVAQNLGMQHEGTLRSYAFVGGEAVDEAIYAVLRP